MKSVVVLFAVLGIYVVSFGVVTSLFGNGAISLALGGLLGTFVLLGFVKAVKGE